MLQFKQLMHQEMKQQLWQKKLVYPQKKWHKLQHRQKLKQEEQRLQLLLQQK
jgi:hypothetical protein